MGPCETQHEGIQPPVNHLQVHVMSDISLSMLCIPGNQGQDSLIGMSKITSSGVSPGLECWLRGLAGGRDNCNPDK